MWYLNFLLIQIIPFLPRHFKKAGQGFEIFLIVLSGFAVPRAYILADVATESPVLKFSGKFRTDLFLVFNGEIGYAPVCIDRTARQNGIGGTGPDATVTIAAEVGYGFVILQRDINNQGTDKEKRTRLREKSGLNFCRSIRVPIWQPRPGQAPVPNQRNRDRRQVPLNPA